MQDIDFDELDRAVNSVSAEQVPISDSPSPVSDTRSSDTSPASRRSSGRFMDVVHPSSDMRPAPTDRSTARRTVIPQREVAPERTSDWPDPLDFHGFKEDEPKQEALPTIEVVPIVPVEEATSLESPFISDAKVEKRPLGAFSDQAPVQKEAEEPELLLEAPDIELIEAESESTEAESQAAPAEEINKEEVPIEPVVSSVEEESASGPTSIPQQYKEHPSTTEQPSGAIFDTESYHKPLQHAPKKSGALIIVWIVAVIVVGAGAGTLAYLFILPML